jgi:phospholipase C
MHVGRFGWRALVVVVAGLAAAGCMLQPPAASARLENLEHIIVIYAENRSFDHLYGLFPGANGIAQATPGEYTQVDRDGAPLAELPPAWLGKDPDPAFPHRLPNRPFRLDAPPLDLPLSKRVRGAVHRLYQNFEQINGGRNDRFAAVSDAGGYVMAYYDGSKLPMWQWARDYVLADNFFMAAHGDSFINHQWLICACTPRDEAAPANLRAQVVFSKPQGSLNEHPSYTDVLSGDTHIAGLIAKIKASPLWSSSAIIVTYDENGGFWDHAAPPKGDRWGPGTRIPAIIVSPYAKRGYVDHTPYDTTSIIKFITVRFGLELLPGVRPSAGDLTAAFDFAR